jgi:hypothetical protein
MLGEQRLGRAETFSNQREQVLTSLEPLLWLVSGKQTMFSAGSPEGAL